MTTHVLSVSFPYIVIILLFIISLELDNIIHRKPFG